MAGGASSEQVTFRFRPRALEQIDAASAWYERERAALGMRFEGAVWRAAALAATSPRAGKPIGLARRWRVPKFPYSLVYSEEPGGIVVLGVLHHKLGSAAIARDLDDSEDE